MNWLAHLFLSEPTAAFRIGNLLPDLVPAAKLQELPAAFGPGVQCHRRIDAFTDSHVVFRRSIARLAAPHRRFGGVLMDMFYDHFLAVNWANYSSGPLEQFAQSVYADLEEHWHELPAEATDRLGGMRQDDWLCSYREIANVRLALDRIGARLRRPRSLGDAVAELERNYAALQTDFEQFFPELQAHVQPVAVA